MADKLPPWVRTEIDAICRKFLWVGHEQSIRGKCTVAWPVVTTPAVFGGLGVINLKLSSWAMQTRWLWLQRTDESRAWSELPIQVDAQAEAFFRASITISVGDGMRTKFWTDRWLDGQSIHDIAPHLLTVVSARARKNRTVAQAMPNRAWTRDITGGLSVPAIASYLLLWDRLENTCLQPDVPDRCIWRWTDHGQFTSKSAYLMMHQGSSTFAGADLVWKTWAPLKVKLFQWLAFKERLWTADRRVDDDGMVLQLWQRAISVISNRKQSTTSSSPVRSPCRSGGSS